LLADPDQYLTLQVRGYIPTGQASKGLGTGHYSVEPTLLYYKQIDRWTLQGQAGDWMPTKGDKSAGNILLYGAGLGYDIYRSDCLRITPITEFFGWTVLHGFESFFGDVNATSVPGLEVPTTHGVEDAGGTTIIDGKIGVRTYFGENQDLYVGYGRALTGDRWYKDLFRVEYRYKF